MPSITKKKLSYNNAKIWRNSVYNSGTTDPVLYIFIGNNVPYANESSPDSLVDTISTEKDVWNNIYAAKKITANEFITQYLKSDGLKMISSLNNKIIVQKDEVINLFSLKNEFESSRFIDCLSLHFFKIKRGDCLFIKDTSSAQKKYLYNLL